MWLFASSVLAVSTCASAAICAKFGWRGRVLLASKPFRYGCGFIGAPSLIAGSIVLLPTGNLPLAIGFAALGTFPGARFLWRAQKRTDALKAPTAEMVQELVERLQSEQPAPGTTSVLFEASVVAAADKLVLARNYDGAAKILNLLAWEQLDEGVCLPAALLLCRCYVESQMFEQADVMRRRAKDLVERGDRADKLEYALLDARIAVHGSSPTKAGRRLERIANLAPEDPRKKAEWLVLRIHAAVASSEQDKAMVLLGELKSTFGEPGMQMLAGPVGPATAFAAEATRTSAYR